ncbi:hypothetical protein [Brevifollis gellanilyticus]|uniref:Uncharacterized protein n=1 Tax=Brevifollis gellanilyticus TaxID=748831 RepID=A0A512M7Z3_9BACT|nr:hypothetical protein [Brevifollis gellanilyticus]GEP42856.1 hypothetical protein BGE01nite_21470 [Brevifollis gellanilyticus]
MHLPGIFRARTLHAALIGTFMTMATLAQTPAPVPPPPPVPPKPGEEAGKAKIPEDLLGDEHIREEFGVNQFTTPSIRKLFEMLDGLGKLSYDALKRPITRKTPSDRVLVSLGLGSLIADGFLIVQCEKVEAMEDVGRALIKYAKVLGTGQRMNRHTQSLFEHSIEGKWDQLRSELALTQADVEAEMVTLRDVDIAHLVSLGGWVRAFEIATRSVADNYAPEKTQRLIRPDIAEYYAASLSNLSPALQANESLKAIQAGLSDLVPLMGGPEAKSLTEEQTQKLADKAAALAKIVTEPMKG